MNRSTNPVAWGSLPPPGRRRVRRGGAAFCAALLVAFLCPAPAAAETPAAAWQRVERVRQAQGPDRALPLARAALAAHPDFVPLWMQYGRLRTSQGGFAAARTLRDSLRVHGTPAQARTAAAFLAREEGRFRTALDTLALVPPPRPGSPGEVLRLLDEAALHANAGGLDRADSLLARLRSGAAAPRTDSVVGMHTQFALAQLEALRQVRSGRGAAAAAALADLARRASAQEFLDTSMRAQHLRARVLAGLGRHEAAVAAYDSSRALAARLGDRWQAVASASWQAFSLEQLYRYGPALELRERCLREFPVMGDTIGVIHTEVALGWDAMNVGDTRRAEELLLRALHAGRRRGWTWMETQASINLGALAMNVGRYDRSRDFLAQALELARAAGDRVQEVSALNNIAILDLESGRADRALATYGQLLAVHRRGGDVDGQLTVLNNMALASEELGRPDQARVMYERALALAEEHGRPDTVLRINLGRNQAAAGRWADAERALRRAIVDARGRRDLDDLAGAHAQLGRCLSLRRRDEEARRHLARADSLRRAAGVVSDRVTDLMRLAQVERRLGRPAAALAALDTAGTLVGRRSVGLAALLRAERADACLQAGDTAAARAQARLALAAAGTTGAWENAGTRARKQIAAGRALGVLLASGRGGDPRERAALARETFVRLQQVQSRSLLAYVQGGQRAIEPDVPDSLVAQERAARYRVDRLARACDGGGAPPSAADSLRLALAEAQTAQERLRTLIFNSDKRYRDLARPLHLTAAALDTLLAPGTLVLDYLAGRGCEPGDPCPLLLFAADARGVSAFELGDTPAVARQVDLLLDLLAGPPGAGDAAAVQLMLDELGDRLLGPVADRLATCDELIVVPDGPLTRVPFAALRIPTPGAPGGRAHLVERTAIQTAPSLAILHRLRNDRRRLRTPHARWDIAVWAAADGADSLGALPHAHEELRALTSRFARTAVLDADPAGAPDPGRRLADLAPVRSSKVLHFIAHGYFDDRQPWRSGLYLAPDLKLEIADVRRLELDGSLVTLSACETARGNPDEGVGFLGFTQAFLGSGATSVLATLWAIDDASTPVFMSAFYDHLAAGAGKAEALRLAQLEFLADPHLRAPFHWAPYVLLGDGDGGVDLVRRESGPWRSRRVVSVLGVLVLAGVAWSRRRPRRR